MGGGGCAKQVRFLRVSVIIRLTDKILGFRCSGLNLRYLKCLREVIGIS
jgi:hypothetical protein